MARTLVRDKTAYTAFVYAALLHPADVSLLKKRHAINKLDKQQL